MVKAFTTLHPPTRVCGRYTDLRVLSRDVFEDAMVMAKAKAKAKARSFRIKAAATHAVCL